MSRIYGDEFSIDEKANKDFWEMRAEKYSEDHPYVSIKLNDKKPDFSEEPFPRRNCPKSGPDFTGTAGPLTADPGLVCPSQVRYCPCKICPMERKTWRMALNFGFLFPFLWRKERAVPEILG